jgi:hypothetical protein
MHYTLHVQRPIEHKGKSPNVCWCIEHMEPFFQNLMITPDQVLLSIIDADTFMPEAYLKKVDEQLFLDENKKDTSIFIVPNIYVRNEEDINAFGRVRDMMDSAQNIAFNGLSAFDIRLPFGYYSMSYNLIKSVGYYDTVEEAMCEDIHNYLKLHFKTQGAVKPIFINIPFTQTSVSTGKGLYADVAARFWQAERHGRGIVTAAYATKKFL